MRHKIEVQEKSDPQIGVRGSESLGNPTIENLSNSLDQGWGTIYHHGPHELWIITGGPQIIIYFILKFYLYLNTRDRGFL